ncbi:spore wall protein 2-like [Andrographis paniculata]|uniref:spore wall protein 2-like n=1 Tax=Andrographis paniculata TaxID=175694 RepID=UPI0021E80721|nr:spore wall protein 2-like [Andrographis paniculata]
MIRVSRTMGGDDAHEGENVHEERVTDNVCGYKNKGFQSYEFEELTGGFDPQDEERFRKGKGIATLDSEEESEGDDADNDEEDDSQGNFEYMGVDEPVWTDYTEGMDNRGWYEAQLHADASDDDDDDNADDDDGDGDDDDDDDRDRDDDDDEDNDNDNDDDEDDDDDNTDADEYWEELRIYQESQREKTHEESSDGEDQISDNGEWNSEDVEGEIHSDTSLTDEGAVELGGGDVPMDEPHLADETEATRELDHGTGVKPTIDGWISDELSEEDGLLRSPEDSNDTRGLAYEEWDDKMEKSDCELKVGMKFVNGLTYRQALRDWGVRRGGI